ncbi:LysR family transcriptional regulator [Enemella evansiae]|uniref:LysR family transcriptional regulator n=1 Tax=Enemella evansiae TaxID=2016499 RepID=A0A255FYK4_9ACTN|nr:LysR family transcriptional regulator [Enemella evansiae]
MHSTHGSIYAGRVELTQLRTFAAVARTGSISRAAAELGYSQSALSRQLQALEADLGVPLLERVARGIRLTLHGEALLPHAREVVRSVAQARVDVAEAAEAEVRLRLGSVPSATASLVVPALAVLERTRPRLAVALRQGSASGLIGALAAGELDAAVVLAGPDDRPRPGLVAEPVLTDELRLLAPADHPAAAAGVPVALAELADQTWVEAVGDQGLLRRVAADAGLRPRRVRRAPDHAARVAYVSSGLGLALVPGLLAADLPAGLAAVPLRNAPTRDLVLVRPERAEQPAALAAVREALTGS